MAVSRTAWPMLARMRTVPATVPIARVDIATPPAEVVLSVGANAAEPESTDQLTAAPKIPAPDPSVACTVTIELNVRFRFGKLTNWMCRSGWTVRSTRTAASDPTVALMTYAPTVAGTTHDVKVATPSATV